VELQTLRLNIDGAWEPEDFIDLLRDVESLYYKAAANGISRRSPFFFLAGFYLSTSFTEQIDVQNRYLLAEARSVAPKDSRLWVVRIEYGSPGSVDLLGLGKIVEVIGNIICAFAKYLADRPIQRERARQAALETERKAIEVERDRESLRTMKIENAFKLLELNKNIPPELRDVIIPLFARDQDSLIRLVADGKLLDAQIVGTAPPEEEQARAG
jgi:hypothetical protein